MARNRPNTTEHGTQAIERALDDASAVAKRRFEAIADRLAKEPDSVERRKLVMLLARFGHLASVLAPYEVCECLTNALDDPGILDDAVIALGRIGPAMMKAIPRLEALLKGAYDGKNQARIDVVQSAIEEIAGEKSLASFVEEIHTPKRENEKTLGPGGEVSETRSGGIIHFDEVNQARSEILERQAAVVAR